MKKLVVIILGSIFLLSGCARTGTVTCVDGEQEITLHHRNGQIETFVMVEEEYIGDLTEDELAMVTAMFDEMEETAYSIEGDYLTMTISLGADNVLSFMDDLALDAYLESAEARGVVCS